MSAIIKNKLFLAVVGVGIILIVIASAFILTYQQPVKLANLGSASNFKLVDQDNNNVTLNNYTGKVLVIDFIYSHCTDMCPIETAKMNTLLTQLQNAGYTSDQFHFISISFDYKFDNATTMKAYATDRAEGQFQYWSFLSGTKDNVLNVTKAYGNYGYYLNTTVNNTTVPVMTSQPLANNTIDYMTHNLVLTIIDSQGIRRDAIVGAGWPSNDVFKIIKTLIKME